MMRLILCRRACATRLLRCLRNSMFLRREKVFQTMRLRGQNMVMKQFTRLVYPSVRIYLVFPRGVQHGSAFGRSSVHFSSWNPMRIFFKKGRSDALVASNLLSFAIIFSYRTGSPKLRALEHDSEISEHSSDAGEVHPDALFLQLFFDVAQCPSPFQVSKRLRLFVDDFRNDWLCRVGFCRLAACRLFHVQSIRARSTELSRPRKDLLYRHAETTRNFVCRLAFGTLQ